jgi:PadR family transcriptional regulator PadR
MPASKNALSGNTTMLVLRLLEGKDMYGYQIIEELSEKSEDIFRLKTGTLYPILHGLENSGMLVSYDEDTDNQRVRKYYQITKQGKGLLTEKKAEWDVYTKAVSRVMEGSVGYAFA